MTSLVITERHKVVPITSGKAAQDPWNQSARLGCWVVCTALALLELWSGRQYTDPDGISYLDLSDALLANHWHLLVNAYWSPLYPLMIGAARWLIRPSAYWELPVVHLVNFCIFLGTLVAFDFFLEQVIHCQHENRELQARESMMPLTAAIWRILGFSVFAWSTFVLANGVRKVVPDLCVAAFVYIDTGLLLRLRAKQDKASTFLLLGAALGLGYYAKAALFPIAFVFMGLAFFAAGGTRRSARSSLLMLLAFGVLAAPLIIATSLSAGHLTFGESGSNNYARLVGGEPTLPFYSSGQPSYLQHPLNRVHRHPDVYEFGHPFQATYPLWYDISYWDAGFHTRFNARQQLRVIANNAKALFRILVIPCMLPIAAYIVLFAMGFGGARYLSNLANWWLLVPGTAGLCMYSLVTVEPRYIAAFAVLIWLGLLSGVTSRRTSNHTRRAAIATLIFAGWMTAMAAGLSLYHLGKPLPILQGHGGRYYQVAQSLKSKGLQPGQAVGIVGSGWDAMIWARLARVHIVAQIPPEDAAEFWGHPDTKAEVYDAFARAGADALITGQAPPSRGFGDWQKVGETPYSVHFLAPSTSK